MIKTFILVAGVVFVLALLWLAIWLLPLIIWTIEREDKRRRIK